MTMTTQWTAEEAAKIALECELPPAIVRQYLRELSALVERVSEEVGK